MILTVLFENTSEETYVTPVPAVALSYSMNRDKFIFSARHHTFQSTIIIGDEETFH